MDTAYYTVIQGSKKGRQLGSPLLCEVSGTIFESKLLICEDELHCMSRDMFRGFEACLEGDFS